MEDLVRRREDGCDPTDKRKQRNQFFFWVANVKGCHVVAFAFETTEETRKHDGQTERVCVGDLDLGLVSGFVFPDVTTVC